MSGCGKTVLHRAGAVAAIGAVLACLIGAIVLDRLLDRAGPEPEGLIRANERMQLTLAKLRSPANEAGLAQPPQTAAAAGGANAPAKPAAEPSPGAAEAAAAMPGAGPAARAAPAADGGRPREQASAPSALDLNRAGQQELMTLPGIGEAKAKAILDYRRQAGGFRSADELLNVKGIGEKTMERLRPLVRVESAE